MTQHKYDLPASGFYLLQVAGLVYYVLAGVEKSISSFHGPSAPTHGRWVTPNGLQRPGRNVPQSLEWGLSPSVAIYLKCQSIANLGQRMMLQGPCTQPRPSLLYLGFHQG